VSLIFEKVEPLVKLFADKFENISVPKVEPGLKKFDWYNKAYYSFQKFRRAHLEVLDRREKNNMWIMHTTIFPHLDDDCPIFGFDIICTQNKVSGIFHDFSITTNPDHDLQKIFKKNVEGLKWKKERELPDWGKVIFSKDMIAAGGSSTPEELDQIVNVCVKNLDDYLLFVGINSSSKLDPMIQEMHNKYCIYQKKNPYPIRMLMNFGLSKEDAEEFVNNHLFPEFHSL
jgi:hypothetical protein